jgi:SAM-dependent methyltransferase
VNVTLDPAAPASGPRRRLRHAPAAGGCHTGPMPREQRLVFGEVAETYDRHRPSYPDRLVDDLIEQARLDGGRAVLEVGAGTGKATTMFAARGIPVVGVEPSAEMAAVARRNLATYPHVAIERGDFETWDPAGRTFPLVFSAQAWHWISPAVGYERAASLLEPGGLLAAFWNRPMWRGADARDALVRAYEEAGIEPASDDPNHPANPFPAHDAHWSEEIGAASGLTDADIRHYDWTHEYSAQGYVALLSTHSPVRIMDEDRRDALLDAVGRAIDGQGGTLTVPLTARLCLARRAD